MTRNVFRTITVYAIITLSCASSLAQETQVPSPGNTTSGIIDAERAKAQSLSPVAPSHGEQEFDRFEQNIFDQLVNPNGLTFQLGGCLQVEDSPLAPGTFDVTCYTNI
jgi:hypothetical protein